MATNDKYDRQLRLWGASGQRALGETCVVLLRATAAGAETCKNLVLPGIGALYIIDDHEDIGREYESNFFLTKEESASDDAEDTAMVPKSRAQVALENLLELNPDVQGSFQHVSEGLASLDLAALLAAIPTTTFVAGGGDGIMSGSNSNMMIRKCIVIASDLEPTLLRSVAAVCDSTGTPLIAVHSYGLIGLVRLQSPALALLDPKPRDTVPDLRLFRPFPTLTTLANAVDWQQMPDHEYGHVPYPYILLHAMERWKASRNGGIPKTMTEKQEFVATVKSLARNYDHQLNFHEAVNNAYLAYTERTIDWDRLHQVVASALPADHAITRLIAALQEFCHQYPDRVGGPLHGSIPDMTASTAHYVTLQNAYRQQADADREELKSYLKKQGSANVIDDDTITLFCQNLHDLDVFTCRTIHDEYIVSPDAELCDELSMVTMEGEERPDQLALLWYLAWRACQDFCVEQLRYPGIGTNDYRQDIPLVQSYLERIVHWYKLESNELVQSTLLDPTKNMAYAEEMVRYGAAELHTIASIVGGVAAQEAVKIVTGQYTPLNYTYVYNGIASTGGVYKV
jgi:NEDD8-activating enzyme E1 regulatory subunit